jgi:hypothetical protein
MIKFLKYKIKKIQLTFFIFKLVVLFLIVLAIDFAVGNILGYFYFKQESGLQYRTTYSIEKTKAEVLVFGSSRANHHYSPEIFEKQLDLTFYNVGRDGSSILYHDAILKGILKRYIPKIVILDINQGEFAQNVESYDRLSSLLPYYKSHPEMDSIIELKSKYEKLKLLSSVYPYNSLLFTILLGNTELNKLRKGDNDGYIPLQNEWCRPVTLNRNEPNYLIDSLKVKYYQTFINECKHSKIQLFIVFSPIYLKYKYTDYSVVIGKTIAKKNNILFFDYTNDTTFINHANLFSDKEHLNDEGAKLFSKKIIEQINFTSIIKVSK